MQIISQSGIIKSQVKSPKSTPAPNSHIVSMTFQVRYKDIRADLKIASTFAMQSNVYVVIQNHRNETLCPWKSKSLSSEFLIPCD